ncbi:MAG: glycoside hydrolase family protein [Oscillospiraceae bacterium]
MASRLEPQSTSTRAQVATLIHRLDLLLEDESGCRSSQRIIDFIKEREGFSATPYWDHSQYTIGYGTYCGSSRDEVPASYWDGITRDEAEVLLRESIASNYEASVIRYESGLGRRFARAVRCPGELYASTRAPAGCAMIAEAHDPLAGEPFHRFAAGLGPWASGAGPGR